MSHRKTAAAFKGRREDARLITGSGRYRVRGRSASIGIEELAAGHAGDSPHPLDALSPLGIDRLDLPYTPARIWHAISAAR